MRTQFQQAVWVLAGCSVLLALSILFYCYAPTLTELISIRETLVTEFDQHPFLYSVAYFLCFTSLTALCLPGASLMMLVGGLMMNFSACVLLSNTASALGATLTMLAARHWFARGPIENRHPLLKRLTNVVDHNQWTVLLAFRLAPAIPFVVFNILCGFTRVSIQRFFITSFLGMLPGTLLYINAGATAGSIHSLGELLNFEVLVSMCALLLFPPLAQYVYKKLTLSEKV